MRIKRHIHSVVVIMLQGLSRLQSSLHIDDGMGTISLSVLYGALVLSCMFLPHIIIAMIGHKYTIVVSFSGYILWMVANGYAEFLTNTYFKSPFKLTFLALMLTLNKKKITEMHFPKLNVKKVP